MYETAFGLKSRRSARSFSELAALSAASRDMCAHRQRGRTHRYSYAIVNSAHHHHAIDMRPCAAASVALASNAAKHGTKSTDESAGTLAQVAQPGSNRARRRTSESSPGRNVAWPESTGDVPWASTASTESGYGGRR